MSAVTVKLKIGGMTCVSCESRIERKLKSTAGVTDAEVRYSNGTAVVTFDEEKISLAEVIEIIEKLDYKAEVRDQKDRGAEKRGKPENPRILKLLGVAVIIFAVYMIADRFGVLNIFNAFPTAKEGMGYGMLFIIGILTSVHCVAMCGGINLSQCVPQAESSGSGKLAALRPSLLYNLGRVISYTVVGAIVGAIGSVVSFSGAAKGIVQLAAGVFMVIMGVNMLGIFPWLRKLNPRMPKSIANKVHEQKKGKGPLVVGLLNGLMPCGPLQSMQLYALSTGSALRGALSMFLFSTGTVPLMFGLGALSSLLSKKFTGKMMKVSAYLVVILGVFMFTSGLSLSGVDVSSPIAKAGASGTANTGVAVLEDGVQTVTTKLSSGRYQPITVQKGVPVKWTIKAGEDDLNGCNSSIIIPKLDKQVDLVPGDNVIEFTPGESGTIPYSCWMGMIRSKITVVDDIGNIDPSGTSGSDGSGNGADPGTAPSETLSDYRIPADSVAVAEIKDGIQTVSIDIDESRFTPAIVVMQKGIKTEWTLNGKKLNGSNNSLVFPLYNVVADMKEGENKIALIPETDFDFSASDFSFFGIVKVVDDLKTADINAIKEEVKDYVPAIPDLTSGGGSGAPSCH